MVISRQVYEACMWGNRWMGVCGSKDSLAGIGEMWAVMFVCIVEMLILKGANVVCVCDKSLY